MSKSVVVKQCFCLRCGKKWFPQVWNPVPKKCAKCGSPYWSKPVVRHSVSKNRKGKRKGD